MADFNNDLRRLAKKGDLTVADLAKWFEAPYATTWTWVHAGRSLSRGLEAEVVRRMALLRGAVDRGDFPVPVSETALTRPDYIRKIRDGYLRNRLPARRSTGSGV